MFECNFICKVEVVLIFISDFVLMIIYLGIIWGKEEEWVEMKCKFVFLGWSCVCLVVDKK